MNTKHRAWGYFQQLALVVLALAAIGTSLEAQSTAPRQALQRLTNDLALQFDLTFRHDTATHRERYDEMAAALAAWNRSPRTDADYALMENWLRTAIRSSMPGANRPLPEVPKFTVPRPAVAQLPTPRPTPPQPKTVVVKPKTTQPTFSREAQSSKPSAAPPDDTAQQETAVAADSNQRDAPKVAVNQKPSMPAPKPSQRDFWTQHPAARPLDTRNPFRDDPAPRPQPEPAAIATVEPRTVRTAMRLPVIEAADVAVNLPELSSRIGGYNQALRRIEAAVIAADQPNARELAKLLTELEQITDQRDFIDLYVIGLDPQERQSTPKLHSSDAALELVKEKVIARLNTSAAANSSTERDILQALLRKLAELQRGLPAEQ